MSIPHLPSRVLVLGFAAVTAAAQCPIQELSSSVVDFAHFGTDVALSGSSLIVGSQIEQAAFLFEDTGGSFQQTFRFDTPTPAVANWFGGTVAISGDTVAISDALSPDRGHVYVFTRAGGTWTHQATLEPSDGAQFDYFGASLALAGDTLAVRKSVGFEWAVHVFERSGASWQETTKLTVPGIGFLGMSLALEGDTLLAGDPGDPTHGFNAGACFLFERAGGVWTEVAKIAPGNLFDDAMFGSSVALQGGLAVVGAPAYYNPARRGSAYVLERVGSEWSVAQRLFGAGSSFDNPVGSDVTIDGGRVLVADYGHEAAGQPGSVYIFERGVGEWQQTGKLRRPGHSYDSFATSIAQGSGLAFVGSPDEGSGLETGVVHVFDLDLGLPISYCTSTPNSTGLPATIASIGSLQVEVNDFTLIARSVPNEPGLFFMGREDIQIPVWDGFLCVEPPLVRLPIGSASQNELIQDIDLAAFSFPVLAGSTWNFQAWFRDPQAGGSGANLSNGVTVTFCP